MYSDKCHYFPEMVFNCPHSTDFHCHKVEANILYPLKKIT